MKFFKDLSQIVDHMEVEKRKKEGSGFLIEDLELFENASENIGTVEPERKNRRRK